MLGWIVIELGIWPYSVFLGGVQNIFNIFKEGREHFLNFLGGQIFLFIFRGVVKKLTKNVPKMLQNMPKTSILKT